MAKPLRKILVANRGEIARRIIRACQEMNIPTVAVYSEADRHALHVLEADEAVPIGPPPPLESYLNMDAIIAAAQQTGCDAIHPGYGFLSENPVFARKCRDAGLVFIGPTPEAMELVGNKLRARQTVLQHGVPVTPGMESHAADFQEIRQFARKIGYPIMIKAAAGGGGKGMRVVHSEDELQHALEASQREALSAFGDDTVYLEKFIEKPRHVEIQVLADTHGNAVHVFERECSIQRRHQKIIEESPSPALDDALRQQMGEAALKVIQAVGYTNAGTVEFLLDENRNFYFLEVNARIQVEHPVTELISGIDLVKQQIRIASGETLPFTQDDLVQRGHALECRIYAEDPENNFLPSIGTLQFVQEPVGPGIRIDSGIYSGMEVTHYYDPILSKIIVWDETRQGAINKMIRALQQYIILGVKTPIPFLIEVLNHPEFRAGNLSTRFIDDHFPQWRLSFSAEELAIGIAAAKMLQKPQTRQPAGNQRAVHNPWQTLGHWELFD